MKLCENKIRCLRPVSKKFLDFIYFYKILFLIFFCCESNVFGGAPTEFLALVTERNKSNEDLLLKPQSPKSPYNEQHPNRFLLRHCSLPSLLDPIEEEEERNIHRKRSLTVKEKSTAINMCNQISTEDKIAVSIAQSRSTLAILYGYLKQENRIKTFCAHTPILSLCGRQELKQLLRYLKNHTKFVPFEGAETRFEFAFVKPVSQSRSGLLHSLAEQCTYHEVIKECMNQVEKKMERYYSGCSLYEITRKGNLHILRSYDKSGVLYENETEKKSPPQARKLERRKSLLSNLNEKFSEEFKNDKPPLAGSIEICLNDTDPVVQSRILWKGPGKECKEFTLFAR